MFHFVMTEQESYWGRFYFSTHKIKIEQDLRMSWVPGYFCREHWVLTTLKYSWKQSTGMYKELMIMIMCFGNSDLIANHEKISK